MIPIWLGFTLFGALSLVVSLAAFLVSLRAFKRSVPLTDLQTRIAALELASKKRLAESQARAEVRTYIVQTGQYSHKLVFENRGGAKATNVDISFANAVDETMFPQGERERHLPISVLEAGDQVLILIALASGRWPPFEATTLWTDPDGTEQRKVGKLRLS